MPKDRLSQIQKLYPDTWEEYIKLTKIEHRLFSFICKNWRGRPLISLAVIVSLIGSTTTRKGLKVDCVVDDGEYESGVEISDEEFNSIVIKPHKFHGEWNYTISPQKMIF